MSELSDLQERRIKWLTRAVRGLLKMEFGDEYSKMAVGKEDAEIREQEEVCERAASSFKEFLADTSDISAKEKLDKFFGAGSKKK